MGVPAIAQTDHGNMFGAIDKEAGIKPILGSEVILLAQDMTEFHPKERRPFPIKDEVESSHQIHHLILWRKITRAIKTCVNYCLEHTLRVFIINQE